MPAEALDLFSQPVEAAPVAAREPETPRFVYRAECGACGHRRAWMTAARYSAEGREIGRVQPNSPGGPMDDPCPSCGTDDKAHVRRCWHGWEGPHVRPENEPHRWRYAGVAQPGKGWRVPMPEGPWPEPVQMADEIAPPVVGTALALDDPAQLAAAAAEELPPGARDARTVPPEQLGAEMTAEARRMRGRTSPWMQALAAAAWDHNEAHGCHQAPRTARPSCPGGPVAVPSPERPARRTAASVIAAATDHRPCTCGHGASTHAEGGACLAFPGPTARDLCPCQGFEPAQLCGCGCPVDDHDPETSACGCGCPAPWDADYPATTIRYAAHKPAAGPTPSTTPDEPRTAHTPPVGAPLTLF